MFCSVEDAKGRSGPVPHDWLCRAKQILGTCRHARIRFTRVAGDDHSTGTAQHRQSVSK